MKLKLFLLIHNEKTYKRYYGQPLYSNHPWFSEIQLEICSFINRYKDAVSIAIGKKTNPQSFDSMQFKTYEPKSKCRRLYENLLWCIKYKEACKYYYLYGLDKKGHNAKDYVAYTEFRVLRNILNIRQRENLPTLYTFNYLALTRDKFVFYQYCKSLGIPYPKTIGLVSKGHVSWYEGGQLVFSPMESFLKKSFDAFCKDVSGESGIGAFYLKAENGKLYDRNEEISLVELNKRIGNATFIIQEKLRNHPAIEAVYD